MAALAAAAPPSIRSQATFSPDPAACAAFCPNRLRPDMCCTCMKKIFAHDGTAVPDDMMVRAALEYSNKGRKTPSRILPPPRALYHGGYASVLNRRFLKEAGVTGVVQTAKGLEMFGPRWVNGVKKARDALGVEFLELNWVDDPSQRLEPEVLSGAVDFIRRHHRGGGAVLVNCAQGKSRSTSMVVAFLLAEGLADCGGGGGGPVEQAIAQVKQQRMMAEPNPGFVKQLKALQRDGFFDSLLLAVPVEDSGAAANRARPAGENGQDRT
jgi:hypothetical protein